MIQILLGELLPTASNEKKGLMPAGGVSRIPYFRYSSDNVYKLEYPFYGIVGGHSDRTNTTSLYVMEVDRIYKIYATSGNTISFKKIVMEMFMQVVAMVALSFMLSLSMEGL